MAEIPDEETTAEHARKTLKFVEDPTFVELCEQAEGQAVAWAGEDLVRPEVLKRIRSRVPIDLEEWVQFRGNSYERRCMYHLLDDYTLSRLIDYSGQNSSSCFEHGQYPARPYTIARSYDDSVHLILAPEAARRLREAGKLERELRLRIADLEDQIATLQRNEGE
jgi:hypothetical protein